MTTIVSPRLGPRHPIGQRLLAAACAALTVTAAAGCGRQSSSSSSGRAGVLETHLRFVSDDPQTILAREELVSETRVLAWSARGSGDCAVIWPAATTPARSPFDGVAGRLLSNGQVVRVELKVAIDAAAVDRIDLALRRLVGASSRTGQLRLAWAGDGERYAHHRSLWLGHGRLDDAGIRRYRYAVGTHPDWRGRISRLQMVLRPPPGAEWVGLCSLEGLREVLPPERLAALTGGGFKAAIDDQIRNALPAVPGLPVERRTRLPAAAELRFFYGLQAAVNAPVEFRVLAGDDDDPPEIVFRATVAPGEEAGRWLEGRVDLARLAGRPVRLRLETTAAEGLELKRGLPLWGNPEVVAP